MTTITLENIARLPIRARVGLALASAEHVLPFLTGDPQIFEGARSALVDGWRWSRDETIPAQVLYDHIYPLMEFEHEIEPPDVERKENALFSTITAMYYVTWQAARREEQEEGVDQYTPLPNDIAEIGEEDVIDCLAYAAQAANQPDSEVRWQQRILHNLLNDFETDDSEILGEVVPSHYFSEQ